MGWRTGEWDGEPKNGTGNQIVGRRIEEWVAEPKSGSENRRVRPRTGVEWDENRKVGLRTEK